MVRIEISIEICSNCKEHAWCTRHNEASYLSLAEELLKSIKTQHENAIVNIVKVGGHKMGSFEVTCNGYLLFSKLSLAYFPHTALLTNRISQFIDDSEHGKDLSKYKDSLSPLKNNPNFKHPSSYSPQKPASMIKSNLNTPITQDKSKNEEVKRQIKPAVEKNPKSNENIPKLKKVEEIYKDQSNSNQPQPVKQLKTELPKKIVKEQKKVVKQEKKEAKQQKKQMKVQKKHTEQKHQQKKTEQPRMAQKNEPKIQKAIQPHHQIKVEAKQHKEAPKVQQPMQAIKPQQPKKEVEKSHTQTQNHATKQPIENIKKEEIAHKQIQHVIPPKTNQNHKQTVHAEVTPVQIEVKHEQTKPKQTTVEPVPTTPHKETAHYPPSEHKITQQVPTLASKQ